MRLRVTLRDGVIAAAAVVVLAGVLFAANMRKREITCYVIDDLDGDGAAEAAVLEKTPELLRSFEQFDEIFHVEQFGPLPKEAQAAANGIVFANTLAVYKARALSDWLSDETTLDELNMLIDDGSLERVYAADFTELRPIFLRTGDADGNGQTEISVCVFKTTEFHPVFDKRPFIYRYGGGRLSPVWRGSRLSKPFDDYIFFDITGDGSDDLISVETVSDGRKVISCYGWRNFGFELNARSAVYEHVSGIKGENNGEISAIVTDEGKSGAVRFKYREAEANDQFYDEGIIVEVSDAE